MRVTTSCSTWRPSGTLPSIGLASHEPTHPVFHYTQPTGSRSPTEMLDQVTNLESDSDLARPTPSLDLSGRRRALRARQGFKQSEVARRMRLDPSIPSLWEQGKRLVPANRVRALADALEVSVEELLDGVSGAQRAAGKTAVAVESPARTGIGDLMLESPDLLQREADRGALLRLL